MGEDMMLDEVNEFETVLGLDDNTDSGVEDSFIDEFSEEIHISIPTKEINTILNISNVLKSGGENSYEGKLVTFKVEEGNVKFMLSDNKRNISKFVKPLNSDKFITDFICLSSGSLARIVKLCGNVFTVIERTKESDGGLNKEYTIAVHGGEVRVDNYNSDESRFNHTYDATYNHTSNRENLISYIKRLFNYSQTAGGRSRFLSFKDNTITVESYNNMAKLTCDDNFGSGFRLHLADCKLLALLANSDSGDNISLNTKGDLYCGDTFVFKTEAFALEDNSIQQSVYGRMVVDNKCDVSLDHLRKIIDLACNLPETTGDINITFKDTVNIEIISRRGNSTIKLDALDVSGIFDIGSISMSANAIKQVLSTFNGFDVATLRLSLDGIALDNDTVSAFTLKKAF